LGSILSLISTLGIFYLVIPAKAGTS
jgi:hypothetical protein